MANIILIDDDPKTSKEIKEHLMELDNSNNIRLFPSSEAFGDQYFKVLDEDDSSDVTTLDQVEYVIFKASNVDESPNAWASSTIKKLKASNHYPKQRPLIFILIRFDDDGLKREEYMHPHIFDMLTLPLDRLLFMQKMEILLSLPAPVTPSFLYTQNVEISVEISKQSRVEKISEVAVVVRNPIALKPGVTGNLHFTIPEGVPYAGERINCYGRVFHCEPYPQQKGCYLIYFSYFGLKKEQAVKVRSFLGANKSYTFLKNSDAEAFRFDPRNIFLTEEDKKIRKVAIVIHDEAAAMSLASSLDQDIANLDLFVSTSFYQFNASHFHTDEEFSSPNAKDTDFPASARGEMSFVVDKTSWEITTPPDLNGTDEVLGFNVGEMFSKPNGWLDIFCEAYQKEYISDLLKSALNQATIEKKLEGSDANGSYIQVMVEITHHKSGGLKVKISAPKVIKKNKKYANPLDGLDLLFIDEELVPSDPTEWLQKLEQRVIDFNLNTKLPEIILIAKPEAELTPKKASKYPFFGYQEQPADLRQTLFQTCLAINSQFSRYTLENIGWAEINFPIYIAKEAVLEGLSEFGSSLLLKQPIANGAILHIHGSIFENAPNGNIRARFYRSEPHPEKKGIYKCSFLYYGITDAFLKYTRNFIREKYATAKKIE